MAKLPRIRGPAALANIKPEWRGAGIGTALFRIYKRGGDHPTRWDEFRFYGPTGSRFDHHLEPPHVQSRGSLYAARAIADALILQFDQPVVQVFRRQLLRDRAFPAQPVRESGRS